MEVGAPSSSEKMTGHAALLLASVNLQRERAEFCDCVVVTQKHGPARLYPAHRCVLAASSPVFASLLSSTGVLLDLKAPCLSDTVLPLVLDYIYTGTLPSPAGQQQYCSLLTAATYLQMAGLQEALRAGLWTKEYSDDTNTCIETITAQALHCLTNSPVSEACTEKRKVEGEQTCLPSSVELKEEQWVTEAKGEGPKVKVKEMENVCGSKQASWSGERDDQTGCPLSEDERRRPRCDRSSIVALPAPRIPALVGPSSTRDRDDGPPTTRPSPLRRPLSCGVVPVICHSGRPIARHAGRVSPNPVLQAAPLGVAACGEAPVGHPPASEEGSSGKTCSNMTMSGCDREDIPSGTGTRGSQNYDEGYDHFTLENMCIDPDHYETLKKDYKSCNMDNFASQNEGQYVKNYGLAQMLKSNGHLLHYGVLPCGGDSTHYCHDDMPQQHEEHRVVSNQNSRDFEAEAEAPFNELPSTQRAVCSVVKDVSMATAEMEMDSSSCFDQRLFIGTSPDIKIEGYHDDHCPREKDEEEEEEEEEEDGRSSQTGGKDCSSSCSDVHTDRMDPGLARTEMYGAQEEASLHISERRSSLTTETVGMASCPPYKNYGSADVCPPACTTLGFSDVSGTLFACNQPGSEEGLAIPSRSLEVLSNISNSENKATAADCNPSSSASSTAGQSYHGHIRYHCISPDLTDIMKYTVPYTPYEHKQYPQHLSSDHGDMAADREEIESCDNVGHDPLGEVRCSRSGTQHLLLDISTSPAQLLVTHSTKGEGGFVTAEHRGEDGQGSPEATFEAAHSEISLGTTKTPGTGNESNSGTGEKHVEVKGSKEQAFDAGAEATGGCRAVPGEIGKERGFSYEAVVKVEGTGPSTSSSPSHERTPASSTRLPPSVHTTCARSPVHQCYQCSLCERSFSQRGSLNRHMRSHLGVRPYPCPRCPMTFSRQYRVTEHMRVHLRCSVGGGSPKDHSSSYIR